MQEAEVTLRDWCWLAAIFLVAADAWWWWLRARDVRREAQKWRAVAEHCQRALVARELLEDARRRSLN